MSDSLSLCYEPAHFLIINFFLKAMTRIASARSKAKGKAKSKSPVPQGRKPQQSPAKLEVIDGFYTQIEQIRFINAPDAEDSRACKAADEQVHAVYERAVDKLFQKFPPGLLECPAPGEWDRVTDKELMKRGIQRPPTSLQAGTSKSEKNSTGRKAGGDADDNEGDSDFPEPEELNEEEEALATFITEDYDDRVHGTTGKRKTDWRVWAREMCSTIRQGVEAPLSDPQRETLRFFLHEVRLISVIHIVVTNIPSSK
jgi:hypothetical protein